MKAGQGKSTTGGIFDISLAIQSDQKLIVGGLFEEFQSVPIHGIMRLNVDGTLDQTFNTGLGFDSDVLSVLLQPDGKILVSGFFKYYNGVERQRLLRLHPDGSLDESFNAQNWNCAISAIALQQDGKIIVGGSTENGLTTTPKGLARLNSDGSIDKSFLSPEAGFCSVMSILIQKDGKIIVFGAVEPDNGLLHYDIARYNMDGTIDTGFNIGSGFNGDDIAKLPFNMALQSDGKILIIGNFNSFNGTPRNGILRLESNGAIDPAFNPGYGFTWQFGQDFSNVDPYPGCISVLPDGKILVGGLFSAYNGMENHSLVRIK